MTLSHSRIICIVAMLLAISWLSLTPVYAQSQQNSEIRRVKVHLDMADVRFVELVSLDDGSFYYELHMYDGTGQRLSPEEFAQQVYLDNAQRSWYEIILNITSPIGMLWVGLGLLGQVLFTGRMIVQWLSSEKAHKSVVPISFWWMSLIGASMLITYFIWRKDIVGFLGQATGWLIYVRNLWMIYRNARNSKIQSTTTPTSQG